MGSQPLKFVRVEEQQVLVRAERPLRRRALLLRSVASLAHLDHRVKAKLAGERRLRRLVLSLLNLLQRLLDALHALLNRAPVADTRVVAAGKNVLPDHVAHHLRLHLHGSHVVLEKHGAARLALLAGEDAHLLEQLDVLRVVEALHRLDAGVDAPDAELHSLLRPRGVVAVAVEDDAHVLRQKVAGDGIHRLAGIDAVRDGLEALRGDGVEHRVDERHVLARAAGAELEASAAVRERRSAVAILGGHLDRRDGVGAEGERLRLRRVRRRAALGERLEVGRHVVAEVHGHHRRRRLHRSEAEVVARAGDGHAHQVAVLVDAADESRHDDGEHHVVARLGKQLRRVEQLGTLVRGERPVVVLAAAVDLRERLLVQQSREAVLSSHLLDDLHHHEVLVNLHDGVSEERRHLVLVRGHLAVTRLERDAELEALVLDLAHRLERGRGRRRRSHVVVGHLLAARGERAHDRSARQLQVGAHVVLLAGHEEELLLKSDVVHHARALDAELLHEARALGGHRLHRAVQRRLLVERLAGVRDEAGGQEDGVLAQEHGRNGVEREVATGCVCGAHAAVGERRSVRLSLEDRLALELVVRLAVGAKLEHGELHHTHLPVAHATRSHGLEAVAEHRRAAIERPVDESLGDDVSLLDILRPRRVVEHLRRLAVLAEVAIRHRTSEYVLAVSGSDDRLRRRFCRRGGRRHGARLNGAGRGGGA
mmetsp:Transcript_10582/g.23936  ORF Transcript_10582/g.23936 Transcript_10582/m.23936 type:complete len:709 (-) Transcript_10582:88-2214(-)